MVNSPMACEEFEPERLWRFLTRCRGALILLSTLAAGVWLGAGYIPPDYVSQAEIAEQYRVTALIVDGFRKKEGARNLDDRNTRDAIIEEVASKGIDRERWRTRRSIQDPLAVVFGVMTTLTLICHAIRSDPHYFDHVLIRLPAPVRERIPYFLGRWRLELRDCEGKIVCTTSYRTARPAVRAARVNGQCQSTITWDTKNAHLAYCEFKDGLDLRRRKP